MFLRLRQRSWMRWQESLKCGDSLKQFFEKSTICSCQYIKIPSERVSRPSTHIQYFKSIKANLFLFCVLKGSSCFCSDISVISSLGHDEMLPLQNTASERSFLSERHPKLPESALRSKYSSGGTIISWSTSLARTGRRAREPKILRIKKKTSERHFLLEPHKKSGLYFWLLPFIEDILLHRLKMECALESTHSTRCNRQKRDIIQNLLDLNSIVKLLLIIDIFFFFCLEF